MLSWFTLASILLLFTATPLEASTNQKECRDLNLTIPFGFGTTGKGSTGSSLGNHWLDIPCISTNLEAEIQLIQAFSSSKVCVNNSIYTYSNYSCYTGDGAKVLHSNKVRIHATMTLADDIQMVTASDTNVDYITVIGYESFGFIGYEPSLNINSTLADQEDEAGSAIGCGASSIPTGIKYSFAKEAERLLNITLISMYFWFTMRLSVTGTPSKSSLIFPLCMVGNISSARQPYYEKLQLHNFGKRFVNSVIEVGTHDKLEYHMKSGRGYLPHNKVFQTNFTLGLGFCCLFLVFGITGIYSSVKKHKSVNHKTKFFQKNGGLLLEQHNKASSRGCTPIFTSKEVEMTINCHKKSHIFGPANYGVEHFISEIITLTQINHQNVAKLLGCCLETEAPILVYELASNGTLFDYIHHTNGKSSLPWDTLLKIASESAAALAYLHSASIIHGNVKSSNILLTDSFVAKVTGFGPSRVVPSNESQICTLVQKTLGYLDPEYFHKGQLTDKSDVYSFGMVLLEIVTGQRPISFGRPESQRIMSSHFVSSMELQSGVFDRIFGSQVLKEGDIEQVRAVAELAKRCLSLGSAERPVMEEVARKLKMLS